MGYYCVSEQYTLTNAQFCGEMLMLRVRDLFLEIGLLVLFFSSMSVQHFDYLVLKAIQVGLVLLRIVFLGLGLWRKALRHIVYAHTVSCLLGDRDTVSWVELYQVKLERLECVALNRLNTHFQLSRAAERGNNDNGYGCLALEFITTSLLSHRLCRQTATLRIPASVGATQQDVSLWVSCHVRRLTSRCTSDRVNE